jgi:hypothetical protein
MKNATPSEKALNKILSKVEGNETVKLAEKYRKIAGTYFDDFEWILIEDAPPTRNSVIDDVLEKEKIGKAFKNFWRQIARNNPEYESLILQKEWKYAIADIFFLGEIRNETYETLYYSGVKWADQKTKEKVIFLKIYPGTKIAEISDFLDTPGNSIEAQFKNMGIEIPETNYRAKKSDSYTLDLYTRMIDTFSTEEIRLAFAQRFPREYKEEFAPFGTRLAKNRVRYSLIASYIFHRHKLSNPKGKRFSEEYIKTIVEKAKKNKTEIKKGLIKEVP